MRQLEPKRFQFTSSDGVSIACTALTSIAHDFYTGGHHEMLHEINRHEMITNLLVWISGILEKRS
jgi:hypothetical protein